MITSYSPPPANWYVCGLMLSLSTNLNVPVWSPAVGVKVKLTVQIPCGAMVEPQVLVRQSRANGGRRWFLLPLQPWPCERPCDVGAWAGERRSLSQVMISGVQPSLRALTSCPAKFIANLTVFVRPTRLPNRTTSSKVLNWGRSTRATSFQGTKCSLK